MAAGGAESDRAGFALVGKHLLERLAHGFGAKILHAGVVAVRASTLLAGAAQFPGRADGHAVGQRRMGFRAGGAVDADDGRVHGRGHVHQPRIVADQALEACDEADRLVQGGSAAQVGDAAGNGL